MRVISSVRPKYAFTLLLTFFLAIVATGLASSVQKPPTTTLIVKMAKGLSEAQARSVASRPGGTPKAFIPQLNLQIVEVPAAAVDAITKSLKGDDR